ncbi:uncharacterized protein [Rutidosis leptorrhynchoides]|uniref:uncharacterized protein n=1 Tax=Rutidosis leptorrhynchoides TaxID=125765 RepID=UPI003A99A03A
MGDFNVTRYSSEHSSGCSFANNDMADFNKCIAAIEVDDMGSSGFHFTWTKSLKNPLCGTLKKLDRIMSNEGFLKVYPQASGIFLPYLMSDHSPTILSILNGLPKKKKAFRFMNHIAYKDDFLQTVATIWDTNVNGHKMYQVVTKLKLLKRELNKLNWSNGSVSKI